MKPPLRKSEWGEGLLFRTLAKKRVAVALATTLCRLTSPAIIAKECLTTFFELSKLERFAHQI